MKKFSAALIMSIFMLIAVPVVSAQQTSWGSVAKSAAQVAVQQLSPQAQTAVDQAKKLGAGAPQENFLITKAKEFMAAGNYQPALDLANYVMTTLNSKSIDAKKIMADAQAALAKIAQDKLAQSQPKAAAAAQAGQAQVNGIKSLFGTKK